MHTVSFAGSRRPLISFQYDPFILPLLSYPLPSTTSPPFVPNVCTTMPTSASSRRSPRLRQRKSSSHLSDFDYPGPKHNSIRTSRVRNLPRRNRRLPEEVIVINDDDPNPTPNHSNDIAPSPRKTKSRSTNVKLPVKSASNPIAIGRIRKPVARRKSLPQKENSSAKTPPLDIPKTKPFTPPTSPLSTQDSHEIPSEQCHSTSEHTQLSLGFQPKGPVLGREQESNHLFESLSAALQRGQPSTAIYVCGTPGTGKTYTVSKVVKRIRASLNELDLGTNTSSGDDFTEVWVNCANLGQAKDLFPYLVNQLSCCSSQQSPREAIREYASSSGPKTLLVLDEVDFLTSKDQMVLYSAFEWPRISNSRIAVVGIANAIDLPVRLLPWLRQAGCMPEIISFTPYSPTALQGIVHQRIDDIESSGLTTVAISLAAKKVAAGSGDARLVLDVCREAQSEMRREGHDRSCIAVVSSIISRRGGLSAAVETIRQLPVQQQIAVCVAANAIFFSSRSTSNPGKLHKKATLGGLYDSFVRMCQRVHISVLSFPEFADICCNSLMHHGLVDIPSIGRGKSAKTLRGRPIRLRVSIEDVRAGVAEKGFLPMLIVE